MAKLTKSYIDRITPPEKQSKIHWDDDIKGFGVRVSPRGKKVFIAQGRVLGTAVCYTIGEYGTFKLDEARDGVKDSGGRLIQQGARHILQGMKDGIDPRAVKKEKHAAQKAEKVAQVTLDDVAQQYTGRPGKLKPRSIQEINRHITTTFEKWQNKPIASITEEMCKQRYNEILTKGLRGKGPAPSQAIQAFSILRALINYAMRQYRKADGTPLILFNPVGTLKDDWVTLPERKTRIPESKIGPVWLALEQWREEAYNRVTLSGIDLVMFLILTGARIGEASALTWDRVNLDEGWWHLPDPKNSNPVWLPLSRQAVKLLETRQRVEGSPFVFASWSKDGHIKDPRETMVRVSDVAGTKITPHDLRRSFTTFAVTECAVDLHKVELLTNHVPKGVTARHYLETSHLQYLKPEVQRLSNWIERKARQADAIAKGENVVALKA